MFETNECLALREAVNHRSLQIQRGLKRSLQIPPEDLSQLQSALRVYYVIRLRGLLNVYEPICSASYFPTRAIYLRATYLRQRLKQINYPFRLKQYLTISITTIRLTDIFHSIFLGADF